MRLNRSFLTFPASSSPALALGRSRLVLSSGLFGLGWDSFALGLVTLLLLSVFSGLSLSSFLVLSGLAPAISDVLLGDLSSLDLKIFVEFGMELLTESALDHIRSFVVDGDLG